MNEEKIFCGSGKAFTFPDGGQKISIALDLSTIGAYFKAHGFTTEQGKKMIKLEVVAKKNGPDQYGKTHFVAIDTWKPQQQNQPQQQGQNMIAPEFQQNGQQSGNPEQSNQQQQPARYANSGAIAPNQGYTPPSVPMNNQAEDDIPF